MEKPEHLGESGVWEAGEWKAGRARTCEHVNVGISDVQIQQSTASPNNDIGLHAGLPALVQGLG